MQHKAKQTQNSGTFKSNYLLGINKEIHKFTQSNIKQYSIIHYFFVYPKTVVLFKDTKVAIICIILIMYRHFLFADDQVIQDLPLQLGVSDPQP
jgi:hypothetical protein